VIRRVRNFLGQWVGGTSASSREPRIDVSPIIDVPFPTIDLTQTTDPIPAILASSDFALTCNFFANSAAAARSLVSAVSQALLFTVIRNQQPAHVVEIGTFRGGTTEAMSRAVLANGSGAIHTIGPFDVQLFPPVFSHWPAGLRAAVSFYPVDSMAFFMEMERRRIRPGLVFVDGNHDYEFALFDIQCAARRLIPRGFIFVDNVAQAGPYFSAADFLERNPGWVECGHGSRPRDRTKAFDRFRSSIPGTEFMVLRAPASYIVGERPRSFGETLWAKPQVMGLRLSMEGQQSSGTLYTQCILRGFTNTEQAEVSAEACQKIGAGTCDVEMLFEKPAALDSVFSHYRVEPWLTWLGDGPLRLSDVPVVI
jgi:hypothetical protein